MSDGAAIDLALLVMRCGVGVVMLAHGYNHIGRGRANIGGTARWFGSMGMRPAVAQAWLASVTELGGGGLLVAGLLTPFGAAAVIGVMAVAWAINHRGNGFFIFRPGEGWEYVMTLALTGIVLGAVGPGRWSLDHVLEIDDELTGLLGLVLAVGMGVGGAALLLALCWRPPAEPPAAG